MFTLQDRKTASSSSSKSSACANGQHQAGMLAVLDRVMAVIEFAPSGEIITANANFTSAMGYSLEEIRGNHHRMFARPGRYRRIPSLPGVAQPRRVRDG